MRRQQAWRPVLVATGSMLVAILVGIALAVNLSVGIAILLALCYGLILYFAPVWALVAFVPLIFLGAMPALNLGGKAAGLLVAASWIGAVLTRKDAISQKIRRRRRLFEILGAFLVWISLTALWATDPSRTVGRSLALGLRRAPLHRHRHLDSRRQSPGLALRCLRPRRGLRRRHRRRAGAFRAASTAAAESRLEGGVGDPNFLAAGLVPAMVLAGGVMVASRNPSPAWAVSSRC